MGTALGKVGRSLAGPVMATTVIAALLLCIPCVRGGTEDFYGIEGRPVALNVTVDPGGPVDRWWWDFEGDGAFTWSSSEGPNATHTYPEAGVYHAVLKAVRDNDTLETWLFEVLVEPSNRPPIVLVASKYEEGFRYTPIAVDGSAVDDGTVVLYEWDFDGDGVYDWSSTRHASAEHNFTELGVHEAVLRATDDLGAAGTDTMTIVIRNRSPVVDRARDHSFSTPMVNISIQAHDPDGAIVAYEWDLGDGTNRTTSGPHVSHVYDGGQGGPVEWTVSVRVIDDDGGNSTALLTVLVRVHHVPPEISIGEDREAFVGEVVSLEAHVLAGSAGTEGVEWDLDGDDEVDLVGMTATRSWSEPGTYRVRATVRDTEGASAQDELWVTVLEGENRPPVARPSVEQWVRPGRDLRFRERSHDPDGTIVLYRWDFDNDGEFDYTNSSNGNTTHVYTEEGLYVAVLLVTDNRGEVTTATVNIQVSPDAPGEEGVDDTKGAAVCCLATVVVMVVVVYWTMRRSMATPRGEGGPAVPHDGGGPEGGGGEDD